MRILVPALVLAWLVGTGDVCAQERRASVAEFLFTLDQIRAELEEGKPKSLSEREWRIYDAAEAEIRTLLGNRASVDDLDPDGRIALFNAQERLAAVVRGADEERVICSRERRTGSHFREANCMTSIEHRAEREAALRVLRRLSRTPGAF